MSTKKTYEEQRSQRVVRTATIISCAIFISVLVTLIKHRYLASLDYVDPTTESVCGLLSFILSCGSGFAAGYGVKKLWQEPYEE